MSLIYVTGVSGTGKSAILHELRRYGFEAHGVAAAQKKSGTYGDILIKQLLW